jgi:hypothetical protein
MRRSILVVMATTVLALGATDVAQASERSYWWHPNGHFENTVANKWVEKSPDGTFHFVEVNRQPGFVELYDQSRDCTVRLDNGCCWVKFGAGCFQKFYDGQWRGR